MKCVLKGSESYTHGSEFYAQGSEFDTQGSGSRIDKQWPNEIKILHIILFKWTLHLIKYDIYDRCRITYKVAYNYMHILNTM